MKRILITTLTTALLASAAVAQDASADAAADAVAHFYAEAPSGTAEAFASAEVGARAAADLSDARYVALETADGTYTFAVEATAQTVSEVQVAFDGAEDASERTLGEVAGQLQAAARGSGAVAVFTDGEPSSGGMVVGIYSEPSRRTAVDAGGATHVHVVRDGDARQLAVEATGATFAEVDVKTEDGERGSLLDASILGDADAGATAESEAAADASDGDGDAEGGVSVDVETESEGGIGIELD